jgi:heme A synthase
LLEPTGVNGALYTIAMPFFTNSYLVAPATSVHHKEQFTRTGGLAGWKLVFNVIPCVSGGSVTTADAALEYPLRPAALRATTR